MHPHLHTKDNSSCEALMDALDECHAKGFIHKCLGFCSTPKTELNKCLRAARIERQRLNRENAKVKREKIEKVWEDNEKEIWGGKTEKEAVGGAAAAAAAGSS